MSEKDQESGLEDELLTRSYERLKEVQPPKSLDRRILGMAGEEVNRKRTQDAGRWAGWGYRFAAAATIILTVSVTLRMLTGSGDSEMPEPGSIQSETTLSESQALRARSADSANLALESDAGAPDGKEVVQAKVARQRSESAPAVAESDTADFSSFATDDRDASRGALSGAAVSDPGQENLPETVRQEPDEWLVAIDELLDDGRTPWAKREIALFRERWPDRELDEKYDID